MLTVHWVPMCFPCYAGICGECEGEGCAHDCETRRTWEAERRIRFESARAAQRERERQESAEMQFALHDPGVW